ncbi:MAG: NUDIX hydrolase [Planctomycetota bacterium]
MTPHDPDPRATLLDLLVRYAREGAAAAAAAAEFARFVQDHDDCLLRRCVPGHITASAWILSADAQRCLLTHHRKLDRWLQLGGHVDGEPQVHRAALREAQEESGMAVFELLAPGAELLPLDLDVHPIPARGAEPRHLHWDVRFLLRALPGQPLVLSAESKDLRWIPRDALGELTSEESVLRLERRAARWLAGGVQVVAAD